MLEPFVIHALIAGTGIALIAGSTGCFVVWRRMAYIGDSLAHNALLGVALGLVVGISTNISTILVCSLFALLLLWLQHKKILTTDTLLGILAHSGLSIGLVAISMIHQDVDLHDYLIGDILTVTPKEIWWIYIGAAVGLAMLIMNWSSLILLTIHEDLAIAENVRTLFMHLLITFLIVIVIAVSIRIVGILLITSMLIIPAATAKQLTRSPETMAVTASLFAICAVVAGIYSAIQFGTPSGPSIVVASSILFVIVLLVTTLQVRSSDKSLVS